jgi:hypothetical protein
MENVTSSSDSINSGLNVNNPSVYDKIFVAIDNE